MKKVTLLFITQKIHRTDDDLAFTILWIKEFIRQGINVQVVCLEKGDFDDSFPVYSLGKEQGYGRLRRIIQFYKYIFTLRYNRVFVHMNTEYITLAGWYWFLWRIPVYLWYTHYKMHVHLWFSGLICKRMFTATSQGLPQYEGNEKKIVTRHGIDIDYWVGGEGVGEREYNDKQLLVVHRICRSKRLERTIESLSRLLQTYTLTVYGRDVEKDYYSELLDFVKRKELEGRVIFKGPVPMAELKNIYPRFRIMINMASETIDKTMLEGMLFGVYPVTTPANSRAIGLPVWPKTDNPADIAEFIREGKWKEYSKEFLRGIVAKHHSLPGLIRKMNAYIIPGE